MTLGCLRSSDVRLIQGNVRTQSKPALGARRRRICLSKISARSHLELRRRPHHDGFGRAGLSWAILPTSIPKKLSSPHFPVVTCSLFSRLHVSRSLSLMTTPTKPSATWKRMRKADWQLREWNCIRRLPGRARRSRARKSWIRCITAHTTNVSSRTRSKPKSRSCSSFQPRITLFWRDDRCVVP